MVILDRSSIFNIEYKYNNRLTKINGIIIDYNDVKECVYVRLYNKNTLIKIKYKHIKSIKFANNLIYDTKHLRILALSDLGGDLLKLKNINIQKQKIYYQRPKIVLRQKKYYKLYTLKHKSDNYANN